jgi:hypothetical protein
MQPVPTSARLVLCAALALAAPGAEAHDSWFAPVAQPIQGGGQGLTLALGTGIDFPKFDSGIDARYLVGQGCLSAAGAVAAMHPLRNEPTALILRAQRGATNCWAQLQPFDIELAADKIELYLREINASPELRAKWQAMRDRGLAWHERYTKNARTLLGNGELVPEDKARMALDATLEAGPMPLRAGHSRRFRVLRDGQPLTDFPVQFRTELSRLGPWTRTDGDGWVSFRPPLAGRWLLRGVDLRLAADDPDRWDSRFLTLSFDVAPD